MFIRFIRDYYLNANRMFAAGETVDVDYQFGNRFINEGAAVRMYSRADAQGTAGVCLAQYALPTGIPSSGTIGNNGALSGLTAFNTTYSLANSSGIYLYFPANAVFAGSPAGFYYTIMSSGTAGTIYQEMWSGTDVPVAPVVPTPWVTTGPGAYTQSVATVIELSNIVLPPNVMGPFGSVLGIAVFSNNNSANNKTTGRRYNSTTTVTTTVTTNITSRWSHELRNRGSANLQVHHPSIAGSYSSTTTSIGVATFDTTAPLNIKWMGQLAVATDFIVLESLCEMLMPSYGN